MHEQLGNQENKQKRTRQRQLTPIILATWEAETGRIKGQGQSVQII
jgi:hypothetical protein